jgi:hypothetical protein
MVKADIDSKKMNGCGYVSIKLYLQKQVVGWNFSTVAWH